MSLRKLFRRNSRVIYDWKILCNIWGFNSSFWVEIPGHKDISRLKELIFDKCDPKDLGVSVAQNLELLKVRNHVGSGVDNGYANPFLLDRHEPEQSQWYFHYQKRFGERSNLNGFS